MSDRIDHLGLRWNIRYHRPTSEWVISDAWSNDLWRHPPGSDLPHESIKPLIEREFAAWRERNEQSARDADLDADWRGAALAALTVVPDPIAEELIRTLARDAQDQTLESALQQLHLHPWVEPLHYRRILEAYEAPAEFFAYSYELGSEHVLEALLDVGRTDAIEVFVQGLRHDSDLTTFISEALNRTAGPKVLARTAQILSDPSDFLRSAVFAEEAAANDIYPQRGGALSKGFRELVVALPSPLITVLFNHLADSANELGEWSTQALTLARQARAIAEFRPSPMTMMAP